MTSYTTEWYIGADIGQAADPTAVCLLQIKTPYTEPKPTARDSLDTFGIGDATGKPSEPPQPMGPVRYEVNHIGRAELGTPYPAIEAKLVEYAEQFDERNITHSLIVDATGVGRPIVDSLRAAGLKPVPVIVHGGNAVNYSNGYFNVPKRDLVGSAQLLMAKKLLHIAKNAPLAQVLENELKSFVVDMSTGHDKYGAAESGSWRMNAHDDILFALSLACWYCLRQHPITKPTLFNPVVVSAADSDEDSPYYSQFWAREHEEIRRFRISR